MAGRRAKNGSLSRDARTAWLRFFAIVSLFCATAVTQEVVLMAVGAECCEDDAGCGSSGCAPVTCQLCACCHFSAVLTPPAPGASSPADGGEQPAPPFGRPVSSDHREPPFRPPTA